MSTAPTRVRSARNRGIAMVLVTIAVALAVMLVIAFSGAQSTSTGIGQNIERHTQARAVAESALELTLAEIRDNAAWRNDFAAGAWAVDKAFAGGTYTVDVRDGVDADGDGDLADDPADPATVTVTGQYKGVTYRAQAIVTAYVKDLKAQVAVDRAVTMTDNSEIDSFDSRDGQYGGTNIGTEATVSTNGTGTALIQVNTGALIRGNALVGPGGNPQLVIDNPGNVGGSVGQLIEQVRMPVILEPNNLGPPVGDKVYGSGTHTISSNLHVNNFTAGSDAVIQIDGDVTILVQGTFTLTSEADLEMRPGAVLRLYVYGGIQIESNSGVNKNTGLPAAVQVFAMGTGNIVVQNESELVAAIFAPQAALTVASDAQVMGTFIGKDLTLQNGGKFHVDMNPEVGKYEPADPLIAHWKLDETAGTLASDSVGDSHGTLVGGPQWTADGELNGGLRLSGADQYIRVPSNPALNVSSDMTFAGWFKLDADFHATSPTTQILMSKMIDNEHDMVICLVGQDYNREIGKGSLLFKVEHGPDQEHFRYVFTNKTDWKAGQWYHFVAILDSKNHANNSLAVDGIDDTSVLVGVPDSVQIDLSYSADFFIGGKDADTGQLNGVPHYFQGVIDDVRIYNTKLTAQQIADLYSTGDAGIGIVGKYKVRWIEQP